MTFFSWKALLVTLVNEFGALVFPHLPYQVVKDAKVPKNQQTRERLQPLCMSKDRAFDLPLRAQGCEIKTSLGEDGRQWEQKI